MVQKFLKENNIQFYSTFSELKASVVERLNKTIKEKMWRYFTYAKNNIYYHVLQDLVKSYNNTYHRTIKTKPNLVNSKNKREIWKTIYGYDKIDGDDSIINPLFKKQDKVRISKLKNIFEKGFTPNWTREIFLIDKVFYQNPLAYILRDLKDEIIEGKFYEQELQKILNKEEVYSVDKII
ncbi:unnamed protein product [Brachionus calyciflorus]|uniref:Integrase catalytic domain-containing protein n=1 Tax=Brachionus calyciflorus TaxID=104777 RepID=A0A814HUK4_9BILA|nr:unnamed protein product [Brachionus calyciflorus]